MTDQCSDCAHCHGVEIKVDFDGPGYLEAECDMESVMTDEDCEKCDVGRCPYYKQMGEDEDESKYVRDVRISDECPTTAEGLKKYEHREVTIRLDDEQMERLIDAIKNPEPPDTLTIDGKKVTLDEIGEMLAKYSYLEDQAKRFERLGKIIDAAYLGFGKSNPPTAINPYERILQKFYETEGKE